MTTSATGGCRGGRQVAEQCAVEEQQLRRRDDVTVQPGVYMEAQPGATSLSAASRRRRPAFVLFNSAVAAVQEPARWVLPLVASSYALRSVLLVLEILAEHDDMANPKYMIAREHACS
jgi:hypothetical protein